MGIVDDDIARVRDATDIAAVIGEQVGLKKVGRRLVGLCPFHTEKTPSFSVSSEKGVYYCFGCGASGDAITFLRETEHLDFVQAVERLASRAGIELRYDERGGGGRSRERRSRLVEAVEAAVDFYHRRLLEADDAGPARKYLRGRGFEGDHARKFKLGWAPDSWDELSRHLQKQKFSRDDLVEAGLAFVNRANRLQDQFRGRLMFPIFDTAGDPVAFGGRALDDEGPKYKNSSESALYRKSRVLYGLNWAKGEVVAANEVVVCEGYTDVMACHLAGAPRAVATCGTALTEDHVRILKRFASRVVLAYDADAAGQAAAERLYEWEAEHELELAVAALPAGRDPADAWVEGPDDLVQAIEEARPFLRFRLDRMLERADRSSAEGRARAANAAIEVVAEHPDPLVRDQYLVALTDELGIEIDRLRESAERVRRAPRRSAPSPGHPQDEDVPPDDDAYLEEPPEDRVGDVLETIDRRDLEAIRLAVQRPELVPDWFDASHLATPVAQQAFEVLAGAETFADAVDAGSEAVAELLRRVAVEELPAGESEKDYANDVVVYVVEAAARRHEMALARAGDERSMEGKKLLEGLHEALGEDDRDAAKRSAEQLVGWIAAGLHGRFEG